jgi:hypothetical protein
MLHLRKIVTGKSYGLMCAYHVEATLDGRKHEKKRELGNI